MKPLILDLCGGTGSWSLPYLEAGYQVEIIDIESGQRADVRLYEGQQCHGVLAAPPCTYFSRMRMCRGRPTDDQFREGLAIVDACLRVIWRSKPKWWVLENPQGYLKRWLGEPAMKFDPWEFGDPWTKRTWLWGDFTPPMSSGAVIPKGRLVGNYSRARGLGKSLSNNTALEHARTPPGFARAFFEANP